MYNEWDHVFHIRLVADYFCWSQFSIMGHCLGGMVGFLFTCTFPNLIERLCLINLFDKPTSSDTKFRFTTIAINSHRRILDQLKEKPPSYTPEAARDLLVYKKKWLDSKNAEVLMSRGIKQLPDGTYVFSNDPRNVSTCNYSIIA